MSCFYTSLVKTTQTHRQTVCQRDVFSWQIIGSSKNSNYRRSVKWKIVSCWGPFLRTAAQRNRDSNKGAIAAKVWECLYSSLFLMWLLFMLWITIYNHKNVIKYFLSMAIRMINDPKISWKGTLSYKLAGVEKKIPINHVAEVDQQVTFVKTSLDTRTTRLLLGRSIRGTCSRFPGLSHHSGQF